MRRVRLAAGADLDGFRRAARGLIADAVPPERVDWQDGEEGLPLALPEIGRHEHAGATTGRTASGEDAPVRLPRAAAALIETVVRHRDPERYARLYALVWRIGRGERALLELATDPLVHRLTRMRKAVDRDLHKMHAFVRFRQVGEGEARRYVAWFEPDHHILEAAAPFFVERFTSLAWSILTPDGSLHWDGHEVTVGPPASCREAPAGDPLEAVWQGYYEATFNPARVNPRMMRAEMPTRYWRNLPEAAAIAGLVRSAPRRVADMIEREAAMPMKRNPDRAVAAMADQEPKSLAALNRIIAASEPLVPGATRAVLGEGPIGASIAFVGEQPGDQEDLAGRPFVGPAGQLLDRAMAEAGIDRDDVYVTNAVKHFKFEQRGKRRLHKSPTAGEVKHYRWWLLKELDLVAPRFVVGLGATAVAALAGKALPIGRNRGETRFDGRPGFITVHPSYLLRLPDESARREAYAAFVADLVRIRTLAAARVGT